MNIEEEIAQTLAAWEAVSDHPELWRVDMFRDAAKVLMPLVERAQAEALRDAVRDFENEVGIEAFDNISARPGRHGLVRWVGIEEAWENQGPFMDWLRNRADRIESEVPGV